MNLQQQSSTGSWSFKNRIKEYTSAEEKEEFESLLKEMQLGSKKKSEEELGPYHSKILVQEKTVHGPTTIYLTIEKLPGIGQQKASMFNLFLQGYAQSLIRPSNIAIDCPKDFIAELTELIGKLFVWCNLIIPFALVIFFSSSPLIVLRGSLYLYAVSVIIKFSRITVVSPESLRLFSRGVLCLIVISSCSLIFSFLLSRI